MLIKSYAKETTYSGQAVHMGDSANKHLYYVKISLKLQNICSLIAAIPITFGHYVD